MQYYMPVRLYEETNCVQNHTADICAAGTHALIVTGRHSARANGSLADVTAALENGGISWSVFDRVEENPSIETVMKGRDAGLAEHADFVIGIGGGSPLDAAKAVALMMAHPQESADFLYDAGKAKEIERRKVCGETGRLPLILVPTTCGTGSEVTGVSVLTVHAKKTKSSIPFKIFADIALIDGKYLAAAPASVIRNTAVDALGHLLESYYNADTTSYSRMCAVSGLQTWGRIRSALLELDHRELTAEEQTLLMRASAMAGMAIAQTGTALPHALSYGLTYDLQLPHGIAVGYYEADYLRALPKEDQLTALQLAGFSSIEEWEDFFCIVCGDIRIPEDELQHTYEMVAKNPAKLAKAPFTCDEETLLGVAGLKK